MEPYPKDSFVNPFNVLIGFMKYFFMWVLVEYFMMGETFGRHQDPSADRIWVGSAFVSSMFLLNLGVHAMLDRSLGADVPERNRALHYFLRLGMVALADLGLIWAFFGLDIIWFMFLVVLAEFKFLSLMLRWERIG